MGDAADLAAWEQALEPPFDPWVEKAHQGGAAQLVLRTAAFDPLAEAGEVHSMAHPLVERLNGGLRLTEAERPVRIGHVLQFGEDGSISATVFAQMGAIRLRGGLGRLTVVALGPDGQPLPPPPPTPSEVQRWAIASEADDDVADLLSHFGRSAGDWYEVYKTLEVAERLGKRHGGYEKLLGARATAVKEMRTTANFYRHARKATYRPPALISPDQARPLLKWVVRTILGAAVP